MAETISPPVTFPKPTEPVPWSAFAPASSHTRKANMPHRMQRSHYADMFGPTSGDRVRLGDTVLVATVERDFAHYGDECKFGGGKVLRDGMGQGTGFKEADVLVCVITNALVIDYTGIFKADVGIKGGRIAAIGKAGNPHVMAG